MAQPFTTRLPEFRRWPDASVAEGEAEDLADFLMKHRRTLVLSGAGISAASGIPAYRDGEGRWQHSQPMQYQHFMGSEQARRRYWARSYLGWPRMRAAEPNPAHFALARLQALAYLTGVVTQNVDGLHERAGTADVIALHGRLSRVHCQDCGHYRHREAHQQALEALNPDWRARVRRVNPDGDAELADGDYATFHPAPCPECGGRLKPDVVMFGENVPSPRVQAVRAAVNECDAVLVVGSSLVVWSGYRIVRQAHQAGRPVIAINQGRTRADDLLHFKVAEPCQDALQRCLGILTARSRPEVPFP